MWPLFAVRFVHPANERVPHVEERNRNLADRRSLSRDARYREIYRGKRKREEETSELLITRERNDQTICRWSDENFSSIRSAAPNMRAADCGETRRFPFFLPSIYVNAILSRAPCGT